MRRIALISLLLLALAPATAAGQVGDGEIDPPDGSGDGSGGGDGNGDGDGDGDGDGHGDGDGDGGGDGDGHADADADHPDDTTGPALSSDASAPTAKVAVVVVGDPDEALRQRARELDRVLGRDDGIVLPADSGLRGALRGDPGPDEDDGLGRVRRQRRELGLAEDADDAGGLAALGRVSGAVSVVALRRRGGSIRATVLDVASARLYEGELDLSGADDAGVMRFVLPRARASSLRAAEREAESADEGSWREAAAQRDRRGRGQDRGETDTEEEAEEEDDRGFFAKYWPYLVAGLLLAGALIYAFTVDTTPDTPPPVLRFIPGGN